MFNQDYWHERLATYRSGEVDQRISPKETMKGSKWYFSVGHSAVQVILAGAGASFLNRASSVLDVPCGHGRVMRHLAKLLPDATLHACDLDADGVQFCADTFGARPVVSKPELSEVDFGAQFDLIWVGSLFTHLSRDTTQRWLKHLSEFLTPTGIVVATFHGRWSERIQNENKFRYINDASWQSILRDYRETGYGFADYTPAEGHAYMEGSGYGISLSKPATVMQMVSNIPGVRMFMYAERAWADHHDVVVFGKPAFDKPWP